MYDRKVKRLPVVNKAGRLLGIISRVDVLAVFSRPDGDIRDELMQRVLPGIKLSALKVAVRDGIVTISGKPQTDQLTPAIIDAVLCDDLLEASIPAARQDTTRALAVDWSDMETFSRPPSTGSRDCADPEASRGHRKNNRPGPKDELSCGYYLSAATMMREEHGPPVPELAHRMTLTSCHPGAGPRPGAGPDPDARAWCPAR
jgi:hypothetical protein